MNLFAKLNKRNAGSSGTDIIVELTERNRKFEAFLVEKLADLESKIIPDTTDLSFAEIEDKADESATILPDTPPESPLDDVLLGSSLLSQSPLASPPDDTSPNQSPPASPDISSADDENWLAGFDDVSRSNGDGQDDDTPPDVDAALPDNDGKKDEWL